MVMRRLGLRAEAFGHAFRGLREMLRSEPHARFHLCATIVVVIAAAVSRVDRYEALALVLTMALVWSLEAVNTAVEAICDLVSPEHDDRVRVAKDVAAGAVLVAALASLVVAGLVFGPRVRELFAP